MAYKLRKKCHSHLKNSYFILVEIPKKMMVIVRFVLMISMVQIGLAELQEPRCLSQKDLLETILKDYKSGPEQFRSCRIPILSSDHKSGRMGVYFNFDRKEIKGLKHKQTLRFFAFNTRTNQAGRVVVWGNPNGGSIGDAHGRFDNNPVAPKNDQWKVGDSLVLMDPIFCSAL